MDGTEILKTRERFMRTAAIGYGVLALAAMVVGLYGFFSLLWLAANTYERSLQLTGVPF